MQKTNALRILEKSGIKYKTYYKNLDKAVDGVTFAKLFNLSVDNTYKTDPNYKNKKAKLKHLDEKRDGIKLQIIEAEKVIENQAAFFKIAMDADLRIVVDDLRYDLNESSHNLIEIEKQIIEYLNLID